MTQIGAIPTLFDLGEKNCEECLFKIIQGYLIQEAIRQQLGNNRWLLVYQRQPGLIATYMPAVNTFYRALINIPVNVLDPSELVKPSSSSPDIVDVMQDWIARACVLPADALHLSEAERLGIYDIVAFDLDFSRAQGFTIYTYSNSI